MNWVLRIISGLNKAVMALCIVLFGVMAVSVFANVVLRHALASGFLWLQDLALFSFGLLAILSIPCAFVADKHVRVDIFRQRQQDTLKHRIDRVGILFFAIPLFLLLLIYAWGDVLYSAMIGEASPQIGGLPFYYLVKAGLPVACILMVLQGIAELLVDHNSAKKAV